MPQLEITDLKKTYDGESTVAVDGVSFSVPEGEIVTLLGPSGCGKTTTLRCVAGVEEITSGTIKIDNRVVSSDNTSVPAQHRNLGMLYQNYAIWPHKSVYENVVFPLKYSEHRFDPDKHEERVTEMLELVKIPELKDKPATDLSGGQQQRVALARALVHDPELLLLDEPLSNLDRKLRTEMRDQIQQLQYEMGVSILYVTHDQQEAFYLADTVVLLRNGKVMEVGSPTELYHAPQEAFTRDFVGDWNKFPGEVADDKLRFTFGSVETSFRMSEVGMANSYVQNATQPVEVDCFVRPTSIQIEEESIPQVGDGGTQQQERINRSGSSFEIEGTVVAEGVLGELYEFTVDTGERQVTVQVGSHLEFNRGETVKLSISAKTLQVYGRDSDAEE